MKFTSIILMLSFTLFSIFGGWHSLWAQKKELPKLSLAVLPFNPAGVKDYEAISLSNRLHSELVKTRQFRVVEIERVEDLLREMGFQQLGTCTDEECVVHVGNMLGAQWMVTGAVGKVGRTYIVDVRIIDVETRQVTLTTMRDFRGEIDGLLNLMNEIAGELATKTAEKLKTGSLELTSQPAGAFVYVDGKLKGRTPLTIKSVPIGERRIELKIADYLDWQGKVVIELLKQKQINIELKKLYLLQITSIPSHAKVYLNSKLVGTTPY